MVRNVVTGRNVAVQKLIDLFPKGLRLRFNPRRYAIEKFVKESAKKIKSKSLVLDAGAGPCPYKPWFAHCKYVATDVVDPRGILDFVCSLDNIPEKSSIYDAVLSTEVLEHVPDPQKVINELHRILKKNGVLYLTTPQGWMMHQKPHNYFYFTYYGLEHLLKKAGFVHFIIKPKGGYFWFLADVIKFNSILHQIKNYPVLYYPLKIIEFPFTQLLIPFVLFHLDFLDKARDWTMGYTVEAVK